MDILLPTARLGLSRTIAIFNTPENLPGIEVLTIDHKVVLHFWRHQVVAGRRVSEKFYTVEFESATAANIADAIHRASVAASLISDSPSPDRVSGTPLAQ
jgi:hypothetical protein